jgi:aminomethyltransferase
MPELKKTCLYTLHESLGARIAEFGGWLMPIQYAGIISEHEACRRAAALFDTDHMGEFLIHGKKALTDLEALLSCDVHTMAGGQCRYALLCNEQGGVIDDLLVYRRDESEFMLVVNASTRAGDLDWIERHISEDTILEDISFKTAKIDLQGPLAPEIIVKLLEKPIDHLRFYHFMENRYRGRDLIISRTGYTGEMGFEAYLETDMAEFFWQDCVRNGAQPAGLGARDTLRLEMGMPLYGHELNACRNAGESGFERAISRHKKFIGSAVVTDTEQRTSRLCGIRINGRRAARQGDLIADNSGHTVGVVTSGSFAPSIGCAVALGYVKLNCTPVGTELILRGARCELKGEVVETPFYKQATGRLKLTDFL